MTKDLSFVIIGKNVAWSIGRLLESVVAHVPPRLSTEIIYVDSASTDRTVEIVSQFPVSILQLSADQPLCASAGRCIGSQYATGKYIFFLDGDMELLDGWLEKALRELDEKPQLAVLTGIVVETDPALAADEVPLIDYTRYHKCGSTDIEFAGNAAIFRRSVLAQVGTWNPYLVSDEEPELCLRIRHAGYRVARLEYPVTRHHTSPHFSISTVLGRRRRGLYIGFGQTIRYHMGDSLLLRYLLERGYGVTTGVVVFLTIASAVLSWQQMNAGWFLGFLGIVALMITLDSIRTRSLYGPLFHVVHRCVILEGMIKGLLMHPYRPDEYPGKVKVLRTAQ